MTAPATCNARALDDREVRRARSSGAQVVEILVTIRVF
jgi:hypothetical protein